MDFVQVGITTQQSPSPGITGLEASLAFRSFNRMS